MNKEGHKQISSLYPIAYHIAIVGLKAYILFLNSKVVEVSCLFWML